ncbi:AbiV family abortive infection protein [Seonamhaeicola sp. MEBiC1930]|uniref:AbiV family abortive infection protein n=1 Tax=Seonamhaeicola sp. MEBiC01930 TaxID=2976768 RepID=UPI003243EED2
MKSFNNISRNECLKVFPKIYVSANRKWKSAINLSKTEDYSSATFLMITCIEEYLKATILALDGSGFRFRSIKGVEGMFRNHSLRYPVIYLFHIMASSFEYSESMMKKKGLFRKILFSIKRYNEASSNLKWYANLDCLRERALYSNLDDNILKLPESIDRKEFILIEKKLNKVRYAFYSVLFLLNPEVKRLQKEKKEFKQALNTMVNELGLYSSLEEQLSLIRKNGYSSNHLQTLIKVYNSNKP